MTRAIYDPEIEYQQLALDAITRWKEWNAEIETGSALPSGFTRQRPLVCQ